MQRKGAEWRKAMKLCRKYGRTPEMWAWGTRQCGVGSAENEKSRRREGYTTHLLHLLLRVYLLQLRNLPVY